MISLYTYVVNTYLLRLLEYRARVLSPLKIWLQVSRRLSTRNARFSLWNGHYFFWYYRRKNENWSDGGNL